MHIATMIVRHDGIDRTYHATNYYDAVFLFDALCRIAHHVEWWESARLVRQHDIEFV